MKHSEYCCLGRLEKLTDNEMGLVLRDVGVEVKRRWPQVDQRAHELADSDTDPTLEDAALGIQPCK